MSDYLVVREIADLPKGWQEAVAGAVDWFADEATMPTRDLIDRLCSTFTDKWELDAYDSPAAVEIVKTARALRRDANA